MLAELFAVSCFISPNPSPVHWMVSGAGADVAAVVAAAERPGNRLIARADDEDVAFARFEIAASARYRDVGPVIFEAQRRQLLVAMPAPVVPSCPSGGAEEVGNSFAGIIVGVVAGEEVLATLRERIAWAQPFTARLADGRPALVFRPDMTTPMAQHYRAFVAEAAAGAIGQAEIVRLHPAD